MRHSTPMIGLLLLACCVGPSRAGAQTQPTATTATTAAVAVVAATAPAGANDAEVEGLIRQLAADEWRTREAAQQALIAIGDAAVERLRGLLKNPPDPETGSRVEAILAQIDENRTSGPSSITLNFNQAAPKEVLEEIRRQAGGASIGVWPDNLFSQRAMPNITLQVERQPFWVALKEFCAKTGLRPQMMGDRGLVLMQGGGNDMMEGPTVFSGPFMVVARRVMETAEIHFARPNTANRSLSIEFMVLAEPKLQIIGRVFQPRLIEVVDESGNSLKAQGPQFESFQADSSPMWTIMTQLSRSDTPNAKKIARLRGSAKVVLQSRSELWEVPNILGAKGVSKVVGARTFTVEQVTKVSTSLYQVRVTATRQPVQGANRSDAFVGLGTMKLIAAGGKELTRQGMGGGGGQDRLSYTFTFDANAGGQPTGEPQKLEWRLPIETKTIEVPFEFNDLPLP